MAHGKRRKGTRDLAGTTEAVDTADTASTDQAAIVDTAKFKELVELGDDDDGPGQEPGKESEIADTDGLAITDKFKTLLEPDDDSEENPGFDPYNNSERS